MKRRRGPAEGLRNSIGAMPHRSRVAMLDAIDDGPIIAGAYVDGRGGVCPMLAAHRGGGRTSLASFARAWDRYTGATAARRASDRELGTLRSLLEASLVDDVDVDDADIARAVAEHKILKARTLATRREEPVFTDEAPGDLNRAPELEQRHGWAWSRLFRRYDQYEATLERLERLERLDQESREPALT